MKMAMATLHETLIDYQIYEKNGEPKQKLWWW